jgi:DNA-binding response OmpR family regulator
MRCICMNDSSRPLILVVDDTPRVRQAITYILSKKDYEVSTAGNAIETVNLISERLPDLILLDVMMPEVDGFQLCKKLKTTPATENIPVIFLTAKNAPSDIAKGLETGAVDYIKKPYNSEELLLRIALHLKLKKSKDNELANLARLKSLFGKVKELSYCETCEKLVDKDYLKEIEEYIKNYE